MTRTRTLPRFHPARFFCAASALALLATLCLCPAPARAAAKPVSQEEYRIFSEVQRVLQQDNTQRAGRLLEQYFNRPGVKHPMGYELFGYVLLHQDQAARAVQILEEGRAAYPDSEVLARNLAAAYARTGQSRRAGEMFLTAYELGRRSKPMLAFSGAIFLHRAQAWDEAWQVLAPLLARPDSKTQWFLLAGHCLLQMKRFDKAAAVLQAGLDKSPEDGRLWRILGFAQYKRGAMERAAAAYEIAHRLNPPSPREAASLAALYCSLGAPLLGDRATASGGANAELLDNLAYGLAQSGDLKGALAKARQALADAPSDERRFRVGGVLVRLGRQDEAREIYEDLGAKPGPYQGRALWTLAMMAWSAGDWPKTLAALDQASRADAKLKKRAERLLSVMETVSNPVGP